MSEFTKVQHANVSPTRCAFCHTHEGPFIDVHIDSMLVGTATGMVEYTGHIYVCTCDPQLGGRTGCVEQLGATAGTMVDWTRLAVKDVTIDQLAAKVEKLQAELEEERDNKTVSVDELISRMQPVEVSPGRSADQRRRDYLTDDNA